jgi:hypothetical protein
MTSANASNVHPIITSLQEEYESAEHVEFFKLTHHPNNFAPVSN